MCYRIRKDACLPPGFEIRVDTDKHCTLYFNVDKIKFTKECQFGPKDYYYVEELNSLWELHCFKLMGGAGPKDIDLFDDPTETNEVLITLNIFFKYFDFANEQNSDWLRKIQHENNVSNWSSFKDLSTLVIQGFITYIDDIIDWLDEDDLFILLQSRTACENTVCKLIRSSNILDSK